MSYRVAGSSLPTVCLVAALFVAGAAACSSSAEPAAKSSSGAAGVAGAAGTNDAMGTGGTSAATAGAGGEAGSAGGTAGGSGTGGAAAGGMGAGGSDPCGGSEFVALASDFASFLTWTSFVVPPGDVMFNELSGPRTIYLNQLPPKGATVFPVGTIIVKVIDDGMGNSQIFAMVKRGACFNMDGATNWEWFGLDLVNAVVSITWRGTSPPPNAGYGPKNGCNSCHAALIVEPNDYVQDPALQHLLHPLRRARDPHRLCLRVLGRYQRGCVPARSQGRARLSRLRLSGRSDHVDHGRRADEGPERRVCQRLRDRRDGAARERARREEDQGRRQRRRGEPDRLS